MCRAASTRRGFTLVELLVVIAIIGILIALLLPAVQRARESARMTHCKNNIKQLSLACLTYHDAFNEFPRSSNHLLGTVAKGNHGFSWIAKVLPFLEQANLHDALDFTKRVHD